MAITTHRGRLVLDVRHTWEDGRRERIRIRVPTDKQSPRKAAAFERTILTLLAQGIDPRKEEETSKPAKPEAPRLRDFWSDFAQHQGSTANKRQNRARTLHEAEGMFKRWIDPVLGSRRLDRIDARDADRLAHALESGEVTGRKLSRASVANALGLLRRMLSVARRWDMIDRVPEIDASKPRPDAIEDEQWLTQEETARLLAACFDSWGPIVHVAIRTGLRMGELRALRWRDVDLRGQRLHVRRSWDDRTHAFTPPKAGRSREVPLTWDAVDVLRKLARGKDGDALVFPGERGDVFSHSAYARALTRAADKAEIAKHVHPHMTRHTYASHCVAAGIPSRVLMTWGGWESEAMLAVYAHLQPRDVEHWADRIAPPGGPLRVVAGASGEADRRYRLGTAKGVGSKTGS